MAHQLSVFVENKPGRIARITEILGEVGINIRAITISCAGNFGLIKLIVDQPEKGKEILKEKGFSASLQRVLALVMEDRPGSLARALKSVAEKGLNIRDACGFIETSGERAILVLEVEDYEMARTLVEASGIPFYAEELYRI
jgi:hypothetical protein